MKEKFMIEIDVLHTYMCTQNNINVLGRDEAQKRVWLEKLFNIALEQSLRHLLKNNLRPLALELVNRRLKTEYKDLNYVCSTKISLEKLSRETDRDW